MAKIIAALGIIAATAAVLYGYFHNIAVLAHMGLQTFTPELVVRLIGILVAPLGIVMGYVP